MYSVVTSRRKAANNALHRTAIPLRSIAAGELCVRSTLLAEELRMSFWFQKLSISSKDDPVWDNYLHLRDTNQNKEFWFDEIKKYRTDNGKRLQLAMKELPLPGAFNEAAKPIRAIIREMKKNKEDYAIMLVNLYKLACVRSFMIDYAPILKQPGFNVMLTIPGGMLFRLETKYCDIGIDKLNLLTATDKKIIIENWGTSEKHITMNELYSEIWEKAELKMAKKENGRIERIIRGLI